MTQITVLALETALASSVTITLDVLTMANRTCEAARRPNAFEVRIVGPGAHLFRPFLASPESSHAEPDVLIVPAQGLSRATSFVKRLAEPDACAARSIISEAFGAGAHVAGSCTGTLLLAGAGILDQRNATTAWWLAPTFRELFPDVWLDTARLVVTDGCVTTAGAAMAQMDLVVGIVARFGSTMLADACARKMILDERRSQAPYMAISLLAASNDVIARAAGWASERLHETLSVNDLAAAVGQSARTFSRRVTATTGLSPIQFLQQLRVERAVELIERSELSFEEIAFRVGYSDPSTLRRLMRRAGGLGPRDIRLKARQERGLVPPANNDELGGATAAA